MDTLTAFDDEYFMRRALQEAQEAYDRGEVPVGALVVCKNRIIARGFNQTETLKDCTAHAEMIALTSAFSYLGAKYLEGCSLYVTLEPCVMCAGAIHWARPDKLVFGASDAKKGYRQHSRGITHPKTEVISGVLAAECQDLMTNFFKKLRE